MLMTTLTEKLQARAIPTKWLTLSAVCLGLMMLMIDSFVVNVAFPKIAQEFKSELATTEWIVSSYILILGVLPVAMGRLGDIFGRRRIYLYGLALFMLASIACGASQNIIMLIVCRIAQGIGAAIMMPGTLSIITQAFPPQQRGLAIGIWSGISGLGLIAGPILGGFLAEYDWRWIFYVNVPIGALALVMALLFIGESRDENAPRSVDWLGLITLSLALFLVMFGITRGNNDGWTTPPILSCFVVGALLLGVFIAIEQRVRYPLIDLSLFRNVTFIMACLSAFMFSAAVFGSQPYTSLFMQNFWGFTPREGGLAFVPGTALVALVMPFGGIMGQRLGARLRWLIFAGSLLVVASFVYLFGLNAQSGYVDGFLPALVMRGIGIGLVMASTSFAVVSAVPMAKSGLASGTLTMARNLGTAMGVALCGTVFLHYLDSSLPTALPMAAAQAAEQFTVTGDAAVRPVVESLIISGFIYIAWAGAVLCSVATVAALFVRHRLTH
jgi:EmrB/QacA subfamily drug resistance transporter